MSATAVAEVLVDIRPLKALVREHLDDNHPLRNVILLEDDVMLATEYVGKCKTWLRLLLRTAA